VDHLALDTRLGECFGIIEEIENEFRTFHQSNLDVTKKRQPMIDALFEKFETSLMTKFGLVLPDQKEKLEVLHDKYAKLKAKRFCLEKEKADQLEADRLAAEETEKNAKDPKKGGKPPAKAGAKDPKKAGSEREELEKTKYKELYKPVVQIDNIG
jgi:hypothetical protein